MTNVARNPKAGSRGVAPIFLAALVGLLAPGPARAAEPMAADLLLREGTIFDGTGGPGAVGSVAIAGGRIVAVGRFEVGTVKRTIDCRGLIIAPGFIDPHTHCDRSIVVPKWRANLNYLLQGCTTVVTGNCGGGAADTKAFLATIDARGAGTNVAHLIPHGPIRRAVMDMSTGRPSAEQLARMERLVDQGMEAGAWGMSTGLIYAPGAYADVDELAALARRVARHGGIYASHIRGEGGQLLEAVGEAIEIGRRSGAHVHISHFKANGKSNWGRIRQAVALIEKARDEGLAVTADQYPYTASSTSIQAILLPIGSVPGGLDNLAARMKADPKLDRLVREVIHRQLAESDGVVMVGGKIAQYRGRKVRDVAEEEKVDPADVVLRALRSGGCHAIDFGMSENDVRWAMKLPWVATASDGRGYTAEQDLFTHPRSFGTFARKIGRYARQEQVVSMAQAIRSCSGLPADVLGMTDRGYLRVGAVADVVVFDPETYLDEATYERPAVYATGVRHVVLAGELAVSDGAATAGLCGRALRHVSRRVRHEAL
ncbi:MAG: D-aminoacylase [Pirellulales bacterium]|nr:D-aminoacylase [Pirellulales bacterium]